MSLRDILVFLNLLAAMIWTGGMCAIAVTTTAARATLSPAEQIRFFRAVGRRYSVLSGGALATFAISGLSLAGTPGQWDATQATVAGLTALTAALTVLGVINARAVQRLRAEALADPADVRLGSRLHAARRSATVLRAAIAIVTLSAVLIASTLV
jgi:uncharacterized membrane protein